MRCAQITYAILFHLNWFYKVHVVDESAEMALKEGSRCRADAAQALTALANVALPAAQYVAMAQKLPAMKDRLHELEDERERRQPELEDSEPRAYMAYIDLCTCLYRCPAGFGEDRRAPWRGSAPAAGTCGGTLGHSEALQLVSGSQMRGSWPKVSPMSHMIWLRPF